MAAKDYRVCCALFNAYIAKVSKRNPNMMLNDRREITEGEIMMLIDWYLDKEIDEDNKQAIRFDSLTREGMKVEMRFVPVQKKQGEHR